MKLRTKLTLIFAVAFLLLALIIFLMNFSFMIRSFKDYKVDLQEKTNIEMLYNIQNALTAAGDLSKVDTVLGPYINKRDFTLRLIDKTGKVVYEMQSIFESSNNQYQPGRWHNKFHVGEYITNTYDIEAPQLEKGKLIISYYQYSFCEEDIIFRRNLINGMLISTIIGLLLVIVLGYFLSARITKPISKVQAAAEELRQGKLSKRVCVKTKTSELDGLITSINHLASSLEKQENLRKRLTSDVSHELRTPLNTLQNQLEALIDGIWEADAARLNILHKEVKRIANLVKDLEKLTQLDLEDEPYSFITHNLKSIIKEQVVFFEPAFYHKNIELQLKEVTACADYNCKINEKKLKQVITNLLSNSLKFSYPESKVQIEVGGTETEVFFVVEDEGIGISEADLENVFERFYRAENSRNRNTGGAGLGLAIVKEIVNMHQGRIEIVSKEKKGTKITIYLPRI